MSNWDLKVLPPEELKAIQALPTTEKRRYFVAGYANLDYHVLVLFRGDGTSVQVNFGFFTPSGTTSPDFSKLEIIDYGQTVKLGGYEAATHAILFEKDPEYKAYCELNRKPDIN